MEAHEQLGRLIDGYRGTALVYLAAKLHLADLLAEGPRDAGELAALTKTNGDALYRVLRGLAALEVLIERADGRFSLSAVGEGLRARAPGSRQAQALLAGEEYGPAWQALLHSVRTGEPAFAHVFGMSAWEHRAQNPELQEAFASSLGEQTARVAQSILQACDLSGVREVVDLGGGQGHLLVALLRTQAKMRGVLFDLGPVAASGQVLLEQEGLADRGRAVGGDFFASVPAGADLYLLKSVLHDWDDERSGRILDHCRRAMAPTGRLLIIERALPHRALEDRHTIFLDLHMLSVLGGRERSEEDYRRLAREAGLGWRRTFSTESGFQIMEFGTED